MKYVVETSPVTLSEMIDLLAMQEAIPEDGLKELVFDCWEEVTEPLNPSVMLALQSKCPALRTLKLSLMWVSADDLRT